MTFAGFFYTALRLFELVILIPIIGMLAYFVDAYRHSNQPTPDYILVLFITAVLGAVWCLFTMGRYRREHSFFVFLADMGFVGGFIAGVYLLRNISNTSCTSFSTTNFYYTLGPFGIQEFNVDTNKTCAMLKASFAFGIIAIILFFFTSVSLRLCKPASENSLTDIPKLLALTGGSLYANSRSTVVRRSSYHSSRHSARRSRSARGRAPSTSSRRPSRSGSKYYS